MQIELDLTEYIQAPVAAGRPVGELQASFGDEPIAGRPLVALKAVEKGGIFRVVLDSVQHLLHVSINRAV